MPFHRTTKLHNVPSRTIKDDAELAMEKVPDRSHGVPGLHPVVGMPIVFGNLAAAVRFD